jgi:hypothetical protein
MIIDPKYECRRLETEISFLRSELWKLQEHMHQVQFDVPIYKDGQPVADVIISEVTETVEDIHMLLKSLILMIHELEVTGFKHDPCPGCDGV